MWEAIAANRRRSRLLLALMALLLAALGGAIGMSIDPDPATGGVFGVLAALAVFGVMTLVSLTAGEAILLKSMGARKLETPAEARRLFNVVEEMTLAAGLPRRPDVYVLDTDSLNAFAVGRNPERAAVAVTIGLLRKLNRDELQGVVAHEIGHVRNLDIRFLTLAAVMMGSIALISDVFLRAFLHGGRHSSRRGRDSRDGGNQAQAIMLLVALALAILAPLCAQLLYFACSRRREYLADASAARFTRFPEGLASALEKISGRAGGRLLGKQNRAVAPMFIVNPLRAMGGGGLFATHPSTDRRIAILRAMAGGAGFAEYERAWRERAGERGALFGERTRAEEGERVPRRAAAPAEEQRDAVARAREALRLMDVMAGLLILPCACGLTIKLPPNYSEPKIQCPRCGRTHFSNAARPALKAEAEVAVPAGAAAETEQIHRRGGSGWETIACRCGGHVSLSPTFSAERVECPRCHRTIRVTD
ncbi:MAG TPA: M48 family metallopeptidase [Candidatus Sumerlaeota bacterium]|nr:M48 family metallopeptidase [Candidatus Sumerlaeota bacterium]HOR26414.1 M48 family metallopeptidase [Candidatus Sumerlaeota bacterium]HPK01886.1 M48 family metallopeptidase [Candidatus Sumerlaeota bacterium]